MNRSKKRLLIVGCGNVAMRAIPWLVKRFRVFALVRRPEAAAHIRQLGAIPLSGDLDIRSTLVRFAGIADTVLHCAPPSTNHSEDRRTQYLLAALARRGSLPQRIVYISTTGIYGNRSGSWVNENTPAHPETPRAIRRVDAETKLRRFGVRTGTRVSLLRAPGIYAADRLPLERLRRQDPVLHAEEDSYTNHIHADDLALVACITLFRGRSGRAVNVCDDSDLLMGEWFDQVADTFGLPHPPRKTRQEIVTILSPAMLSFMNESRRITNQRMKKELRVRLSYPTVTDGLRHATIHSAHPDHA